MLPFLKSRLILAVAGIFIPAILVICCGCNQNPVFVPLNCYCAIPEGGVVRPYPLRDSFRCEGIWLQLAPGPTFPFKQETTGFLFAPGGERVPVRVEPLSPGNEVFVALPTRPTRSEIPGETLDLPVGLHYFSHLTVTLPEKRTREYPIGNVWIEVLPRDIVINEHRYYEYRLIRRAGLNPAVAVIFRNTGREPVILAGIHLPAEFPYSVSENSFWTETIKPAPDEDAGVAFSETRLQKLKPYLPLTQAFSHKHTLNFPRPVTVEPGSEIVLCFALDASAPQARRSFVEISPVILQTAEGRLLSGFRGPLSRGLPHDYDPNEVRKMLQG